MAKNEKDEKTKEIEEKPIEKPSEAKEEKVEAKVEAKVDKAVASGVSRGRAENIIGDITPPDADDPEDVRAYLKRVESKIDSLIKSLGEKSSKKEDEVLPVAAKPEPAWYDRELI